MIIRHQFLHKECQQQYVWHLLEFLKNTRNNRNVLKNQFHPKHQTRIEQEDWYYNDYSKDENHLIYIVYDEEKQQKIGYIQIKFESLIHRRCQLHYVVANEFAEHKYDNKIIRLGLKIIRSCEDEYHRVFSMIFPEDEKRLEHYVFNGFEIDGVLRAYVYRDNIYRDIMVLSKLL